MGARSLPLDGVHVPTTRSVSGRANWFVSGAETSGTVRSRYAMRMADAIGYPTENARYEMTTLASPGGGMDALNVSAEDGDADELREPDLDDDREILRLED